LDAVIFDCDGVLVDSEILAIRFGLRAVEALGLSYTEDEYIHRFLGTTMDAYFATLEADRMAALGKPLPDGFAESLLTNSKREMDAALAAIEGVHSAVSAVTVPTAVASSSGLERLRFKLEKTGLLEAFNPHFYSGEQVKNGKPAPDLYLHTAEQINIPAAACVAIEDSVHGVVAAKAAGMTVIGFTGGGHCRPGHGTYLSDAGADIVIDHMDQLAETLRRFS
jgi:beta-phosphoglucomutase-like phosphatase (HAD superfamily)